MPTRRTAVIAALVVAAPSAPQASAPQGRWADERRGCADRDDTGCKAFSFCYTRPHNDGKPGCYRQPYPPAATCRHSWAVCATNRALHCSYCYQHPLEGSCAARWDPNAASTLGGKACHAPSLVIPPLRNYTCAACHACFFSYYTGAKQSFELDDDKEACTNLAAGAFLLGGTGKRVAQSCKLCRGCKHCAVPIAGRAAGAKPAERVHFGGNGFARYLRQASQKLLEQGTEGVAGWKGRDKLKKNRRKKVWSQENTRAISLTSPKELLQVSLQKQQAANSELPGVVFVRWVGAKLKNSSWFG